MVDVSFAGQGEGFAAQLPFKLFIRSSARTEGPADTVTLIEAIDFALAGTFSSFATEATISIERLLRSLGQSENNLAPTWLSSVGVTPEAVRDLRAFVRGQPEATFPSGYAPVGVIRPL